MHPIERLRWIARSDGESGTSLAVEAAHTLGELAQSEPAAVLTACRRLLERHPACGPLYWTAARLLECGDVSRAADEAVSALWRDETSGHLGRELGRAFATGSVVVTSEPVDIVSESLRRRGEYRVRFVSELMALRQGVRVLVTVADDVTGYDVDECFEAVRGADVVVVEALTAGPAVVLASVPAAAVVREAAASGVPAWICLGEGRVLPEGLAAAAARSAIRAGAAEVLAPDEFVLAICPDGPADPAVGVTRSTCPPGAELLTSRR
jgi:hypothetical protein